MKANALTTETAITLWWEKPENAPREYRLSINGKEAGRTDKTHFTFSGLMPSTEYEMHITGDGFDEHVKASTNKKKNVINITEAPYSAIGDGKTLNGDIGFP